MIKDSQRYRTHYCGDVSKQEVGKSVKVSGWVHSVRDHGGIIFIDLRDKTGLVQVIIDPKKDFYQTLEHWRLETVISFSGNVIERTADAVNPKLATGEIEIVAEEMEILGTSEVIPFQIAKDDNSPEHLRLKYRFLDLRREQLKNNILLRGAVISEIRKKMIEMGFTEFQTPILTNSSPEGARDYLVPSRLHPGQFYALPQAPQQFKQLLMVAGFDKYFQIAPCFRDEDARADRSPGEFYQLDVEMSFATQEDVFAAMEELFVHVFNKFSKKGEIEAPFVRIPFEEAMLKYGSDKPDLRNPLIIQNVSDIFANSGFKAFADTVKKGGDEVKHEAKFADDFEDKALAGKTVKYDIKVEEVQRKVAIESDEELCSKLMVKNIDELKDRIKKMAENELEQANANVKRTKVIEALTKDLDFPVPPDVLKEATANEFSAMVSEMMKDPKADKAKISEEIKASREKLMKECEEKALPRVRNFILLRKIGKVEKISVDEKELDRHIQQMSYYYGQKPEDIKKRLVNSGNISQVMDEVMINKVTDLIAKEADVTFVEPKKA